jgi:SAM-dependent MidA family methyltransferase
LELLGFTDQLSFLMGLGIAQEIEGIVAEKGPDDPEVLRAKALLMPQRMGRVFKVLLQGKGVPKIPMDGFVFRPFFSGVLE